MDLVDHAVRTAAFRFLEEQTRLAGEDSALRRTTLERGLDYNGQRVPLRGTTRDLQTQVLGSIPLSITTVPVVEGESRRAQATRRADQSALSTMMGSAAVARRAGNTDAASDTNTRTTATIMNVAGS